MPRQRGGNLVILKPANYTADPTRFASSDAKVSGRGCAGTKSNVAAADGEYVSYQKGGNSSYDENPMGGGPVGDITGPNAGPGQFKVNSNTVTINDSAMGAGEGKSIEATLESMPGGGRKTRKTHSKKNSKKHSTKHSTKRSKKHSKKHSTKRSKGGKKFKRATKHHKRSRKNMRKQRGGKGQPYSNVPISFGYSAGGVLPGDLSALANPVPYNVYDHCI